MTRKRTYSGLLDDAINLHKKRAVFEAYVKHKLELQGKAYNLQFNVESNPPTQRFSIGNVVDTSMYFEYCDATVQLLWEGWELANTSELPVHLLPFKLYLPSRVNVEAETSSFYGEEYGGAFIDVRDSVFGDFMRADDICSFINYCREFNMPNATILNYIDTIVSR